MEKSTKDTLSNRLVQLRTERGWTQSDLVEKMYLSQRSIIKIEKGECTLSNLILLADLYEVSTDYLLGCLIGKIQLVIRKPPLSRT